MSRLSVLPIVEGHGEERAIRILLQRVWCEFLGGSYINVLRPIRRPKDRLVQNKDGEVEKAVELAANKLRQDAPADTQRLIMIMVDADNLLPCSVAPFVLSAAKKQRSDQDIICIIANVEYETWFVAGAESLTAYIDLPPDDVVPDDPESMRCGKGWIEKRFRGTKYSEVVDMPKMTDRLDLALCRQRSKSFDKLCRELEVRVSPKPSSDDIAAE